MYMNVSSGTVTSSAVRVGWRSAAQLSVSGGVFNVNTSISMSDNGEPATLNVGGSGRLNLNGAPINMDGTGAEINLNGGVLDFATNCYIQGAHGNVNIDGATLMASDATGATGIKRPIVLGDGGVTITNAGSVNFELQNNISGTGGITHAGGKGLILEGSNSFEGPITIVDDWLLVNSEHSLPTGVDIYFLGGKMSVSSFDFTIGRLEGTAVGSHIYGNNVPLTVGEGASGLYMWVGYLHETITDITKTGSGTWVMGNANVDHRYSGSTTIEEGTLTLNSSRNLIPDASPVHMNGGTLAMNGRSEDCGVMHIGAGTSSIDFAGGTSVLEFADSSGATWTGNLKVLNWDGDTSGGGTHQLYIGTSQSLSEAQLLKLTAPGVGSLAKQLADGEIIFTPGGTVITVQ